MSCLSFGRVVFLVSLMGLMGCSGGEKKLNPTEERLQKLGQAYLQACYRLGRGPKDLEEIRPDFAGGMTDDALRSPNDGEPFVILWGVDFATLPPGRTDPFTIGAYEKTGVRGSRHVLRFPLSVKVLSDEDFHKAVFPPGHAPQK